MSDTAPIIAFFPEASYGAALNCVGIAQQLRQLGAQPVFFAHGGFGGVFSDYGFEEYEVPGQPTMSAEESQTYWEEFLGRHLPHFNLTPEAQLETYVRPMWDAIVETAIMAETGLSAMIDRLNPDAIVLDNVIMFPAIARSGKPWVRVVSCAETEVPDPAVPPYLSGLPAGDARAGDAFLRHYLSAIAQAHARYNGFRQDRGLAPLPDGTFLETSPHLNLLLAPEIVRYDRDTPLDSDTFVFLDGCVRQDSPYQVPDMPSDAGPLVYVSFGSLGSADVSLFKRLLDVFANLPARFLVNVGAQINAFSEVPDNVHLQEWFPQPSVVAQSSLFIHHGGNNSFCEALYFGVPSLVLPYCWDGHDNARRALDTGTGLRLNRWDCTPAQMADSITSLLNDTAMQTRLKDNAARMQAHNHVALAARKILATLGG